MKKLIATLIVLIALFFLFGCTTHTNYTTQAINNNNIDLCNNWNNSADKRSCEVAVSYDAMSKGNIETCKKVPNTDDRDNCLVGAFDVVPDNQKNTDICELIEEKTKKEYCYIQVNILHPDPKNCDIYDSTQIREKDYCIGITAIALNDITLCKNLPLSSFDCQITIILNQNNPTMCETFGEKKDNCYSRLSVEMKDIKLCDKITNQSVRDGCIKYYEDLLDFYNTSIYKNTTTTK